MFFEGRKCRYSSKIEVHVSKEHRKRIKFVKCRTATELTKKVIRFCQECESNNRNFFQILSLEESCKKVGKAAEAENVEEAFKVLNSTAKKLEELFALLKSQTLGGLGVRNCPKINCQ